MKEFLPLIAIVTFLISCSLGNAIRGPAGEADHNEKIDAETRIQKVPASTSSESAPVSEVNPTPEAVPPAPRLKVQKI
jgi:hypothetical protein